MSNKTFDMWFDVLRSRLKLEVLGELCEVKTSTIVSEILSEIGLKPSEDPEVLLAQFDAYLAGRKSQY